MENGKCAIATGLTNKIGFGSSEFHVLRSNEQIINKYLFGYLNRETIRQMAEKRMTGASGHRRVPISFYENLQIPVPPMPEQEKNSCGVIELRSGNSQNPCGYSGLCRAKKGGIGEVVGMRVKQKKGN